MAEDPASSKGANLKRLGERIADFLAGWALRRWDARRRAKRDPAILRAGTELLHFVGHSTRDIVANVIDRDHSPHDLHDDFEKYCRNIAEHLAKFFRAHYVDDCCCCLKWCTSYEVGQSFLSDQERRTYGLRVPVADGLPFQRTYVFTAARDDESFVARRQEVPRLYRADCCSPFIWLSSRAGGRFDKRVWISSGDLATKHRPAPGNPDHLDELAWKEFHDAGWFHCERQTFSSHYRSVAVFPIRHFSTNDGPPGPPHINGFLCLDSRTPGTFERHLHGIDLTRPFQDLPSVFQIPAAIADVLWLTQRYYVPKPKEDEHAR